MRWSEFTMHYALHMNEVKRWKEFDGRYYELFYMTTTLIYIYIYINRHPDAHHNVYVIHSLLWHTLHLCYAMVHTAAILQISGIHSTPLFSLITNYLHQPWHPAIRRFLAAKAKAVFSLTMCAQSAQKTSSHHRALPVTLPVFRIVANPILVFWMVCQ